MFWPIITINFLIFKFISALQKEFGTKIDEEFDQKYGLAIKLLTIIKYGENRTTAIPSPQIVKVFVYTITDILESKRVLSKKEQREALANLSLIGSALDRYQDEFARIYAENQLKGKKKQKMEEYFSNIAKNDEMYELLNSD